MINQHIRKLVKKIERLRAEFGVSYTILFSMLPLCLPTFRRWKARICNGESPVGKPGPKPLQPLNIEKLNEELGKLRHGSKRSLGISDLRSALKGTISRRELDMVVAESRKDELKKNKAQMFKLSWNLPGSIWSMDVFQASIPRLSQNGFVLSIQDLTSGYKLPPLPTKCEPKGLQVALHLEHLFKRFGKPLFLKRDNGGNLNQSAIDALLADSYVLPLNNPCYYAQYNGAIEHAQGEYKQQLYRNYSNIVSFNDFKRCVALVAHELNHISRRNISGDTSCKRFFQKPLFSYSKSKRKEVFIWIYERALAIVEKAAPKISAESAWRIACRAWLVKNGLLSILKNGEVLPY